eukprot:3468979-Rhodomonas_salina.3
MSDGSRRLWHQFISLPGLGVPGYPGTRVPERDQVGTEKRLFLVTNTETVSIQNCRKSCFKYAPPRKPQQRT